VTKKTEQAMIRFPKGELFILAGTNAIGLEAFTEGLFNGMGHPLSADLFFLLLQEGFQI